MSRSRGFCIIYSALALLFIAPQCTSALETSAIDGNELLTDCQAWVRVMDNPNAMAANDEINGANCVGYVDGVVDDHFTLQMTDKSPLDPARYFCIPSGVNPNQTVRVIAKWLEDHPARLHEKAIGLVIDALKENFTCRQSR